VALVEVGYWVARQAFRIVAKEIKLIVLVINPMQV
jgi:hypothetical protein